MSEKRTLKIEIGHRSIIFAIFFVIALRFLVSVQSIIIAIFISYLLATAIYPLVKKLNHFKIPPALSAATILTLIILTIFAGLASIAPIAISQTTAFLTKFPDLVKQLSDYDIDQSFLTAQIGSLSTNLLRFALDTFSVSILLFTVFVVSFYLIQERVNLDKNLRYFFGNRADQVKKIMLETETQLGHWVRTMILLMFLIGLQTYIGLKLIGIEYALPLAIIAGLLEIIPNIGPTIATIPAAIVGFAVSPVHGFLVLGLSFLIQLLENNILVPNLMRSSTGLHPVVIIIALLVGFELGGALLAVLSLPLVLVGKIILSSLYEHKNLSI